MQVIKKITDCVFIVTKDAIYSCAAKQTREGKIYAVAESENKTPVVTEALSEETAIFRISQKLNGTIMYL